MDRVLDLNPRPQPAFSNVALYDFRFKEQSKLKNRSIVGLVNPLTAR
jgi:hypothetical protein